MQMVGTVALDVARVPGAAVVSLAGGVAAVVGTFLRTLARTVVRDVVAMLRTRGPAVFALVGSVRPRPTRPHGPVVPGAAALPRGASALVAHRPFVSGTQRHAADPGVRRRELRLPDDPSAPRRARALLQAAAQEWDVDEELYHDAAMVVTELVANAVDHARTPSTMTVRLDEDGGLSVAVRDGSPGSSPGPAPVDPTAPRGRGMQMVAALAASWGVTQHVDGKTVWAVLRPD